MKKLKILVIPFIIIVISATFGFGGYFYGKYTTEKEAALDKDAAVKGALYDAQEKISQEALGKAQEVLNNNKNQNNTEAAKTISEFYTNLNDKKYNEAWNLLTPDFQKELISINGLKKDYPDTTGIKIKDIQFRSSGEISYLYSVTLEETLANNTTKTETYFVRTINKTLSGEWLIDSIELNDDQTTTQK